MASKVPRRTYPRTSNQKLEAVFADSRINVMRPKTVKAYLKLHSQLAKIVPRVCEEARMVFGDDAELTLQLYCDPEIKDHHLSLCVRLVSYDENILRRMDQVTERFDEELCKASGYLLVTTDLCQPRA